MNNALVPAAATAILKSLLENGLVERGLTAAVGSDAVVTAMPPDRMSTGGDERAQINLFLYQIVHKGLAPASRYAPEDDGPRRARVPLQLDLHYLLTAYGSQDLQMELLLGASMDVLGETPFLQEERIVRSLRGGSGDGQSIAHPTRAMLAASDVGTRIARINLCLQSSTLQDMMNLWSIFQTCYRPSALYKVTVEMRDDAGAAGGR